MKKTINKKQWETIGKVLGVLIALLSLALAGGSLLNDLRSAREQNLAFATQVTVLDTQVTILEQQREAQHGMIKILESIEGSESEPTVTAEVQQLQQLQSTVEALQNRLDANKETSPADETLNVQTAFSWVEREIQVTDGSPPNWHECPGESPTRCARWNTYEHSDGSPIALEILNCRQDGA